MLHVVFYFYGGTMVVILQQLGAPLQVKLDISSSLHSSRPQGQWSAGVSHSLLYLYNLLLNCIC